MRTLLVIPFEGKSAGKDELFAGALLVEAFDERIDQPFIGDVQLQRHGFRHLQPAAASRPLKRHDPATPCLCPQRSNHVSCEFDIRSQAQKQRSQSNSLPSRAQCGSQAQSDRNHRKGVHTRDQRIYHARQCSTMSAGGSCKSKQDDPFMQSLAVPFPRRCGDLVVCAAC